MSENVKQIARNLDTFAGSQEVLASGRGARCKPPILCEDGIERVASGRKRHVALT
ncbi:MAG: hypothetical protein K6T99_10115 [Armatimonadetes bacterium]|nr:hypothetical protein [Armatimonadota bacterium]